MNQRPRMTPTDGPFPWKRGDHVTTGQGYVIWEYRGTIYHGGPGIRYALLRHVSGGSPNCAHRRKADIRTLRPAPVKETTP